MKIMVAGEVSRSFSAETIPRTWQVHRSTQGRHGPARFDAGCGAAPGGGGSATLGHCRFQPVSPHYLLRFTFSRVDSSGLSRTCFWFSTSIT